MISIIKYIYRKLATHNKSDTQKYEHLYVTMKAIAEQ